MSNIRVSVQWKNPTVFAGDELECTITFRNVSQARNSHHSPSPSSQPRRHGLNRQRWKETFPVRSVQSQATPNHSIPPSVPVSTPPISVSPKPALSLSTSNGIPHIAHPSSTEDVSDIESSKDNKHRRSVSIVSIGGDTIYEAPSSVSVSSFGRPMGAHARAASLQVLPKRLPVYNSGTQRGSEELSSAYLHS